MKVLLLVIITTAMISGCSSSFSESKNGNPLGTVNDYNKRFIQGQTFEIESNTYKVVRPYFSASGKQCAVIQNIGDQVNQRKTCYVEDEPLLLPQYLKHGSFQ